MSDSHKNKTFVLFKPCHTRNVTYRQSKMLSLQAFAAILEPTGTLNQLFLAFLRDLPIVINSDTYL